MGKQIWKAVKERNKEQLASLLAGKVDPEVFHYTEMVRLSVHGLSAGEASNDGWQNHLLNATYYVSVS